MQGREKTVKYEYASRFVRFLFGEVCWFIKTASQKAGSLLLRMIINHPEIGVQDAQYH